MVREAARVGYGREMTTVIQDPFALTGLTSRGGLSNWVLFVFPTEVVIVDAGLRAAIKAGVQAGARSQLGLVGQAVLGRPSYGPQKGDHEALETWCSALRSRAKNVVALKDDEIRTVRLHMTAMSHELFVGGADGTIWKFGMMNRKEAEANMAPLTGRFGSRFQVSASPVFSFFKRYAPLLMR